MDELSRVTLDRPFTAGMVTDLPAHKLGPQNSVFAQDLIAPNGVAVQRHGWSYDGTTADVAANLTAVYRNKFLLADVTRTLTGGPTGILYIHNSAAAGTQLGNSPSVQRLPRCVYQDQLIWCAQDGTTPLVRYSGAPTQTITSTGSFATTANRATETGGTFASTPSSGYFFRGVFDGSAEIRIIEGTSTSSVTLENVLFTTVVNTGGASADAIGRTACCVNVYSAGTLTSTSSTATGLGTKWSTFGVATGSFNDNILIMPPGADAAIGSVNGTVTETSLGGNFTPITTATSTPYAVLRACPFTDAEAHKGSFWGTGVAQYPNRVYVGPPGWDLASPPGFEYPWDPHNSNTSSNANDFLMDYVDVPSPYDGDVNVAILSSPNPLLVLKRKSVHGVFGSWPTFSQDKIADGVGCIDIRSAISGPNGQFWAGEDDIYAYVAGQIVPLTEGRISREWKSLTADFSFTSTDYCAIGENNGHLFVSLVTGGGATSRCYVFDMRAQAWMSRFTNHKARYFFSSSVDGESNELYWVGDNDQGRVMKSSGCIDLTGVAKDGDGDSPRLQAWTPEGLDGTGSLDDETRMLDLSVVHNVYDAGAAGSTVLATSVVSGASLTDNASATKTLDDINSDTTDRVDRTRFREVNSKGRIQQVRFDADTLGTNSAATKVEIHELSATFRNRRSRT